MYVYDDGYVIRFEEGKEALFSLFNPFNHGRITSETSHTVKDGETLWDIASDLYQSTSMWFVIAEWNNLSNPLTLEAGAELKIPHFG